MDIFRKKSIRFETKFLKPHKIPSTVKSELIDRKFESESKKKEI